MSSAISSFVFLGLGAASDSGRGGFLYYSDLKKSRMACLSAANFTRVHTQSPFHQV
jgi:hypothetical protein